MGVYCAFISYRREDLHTAEMIRMKLEARGIRCFMDKHAITGGDEWERLLYENVQSSPNFLCILTDAAVAEAQKHTRQRNRDIFRNEIRRALDCLPAGKRILSVLCKGYRFPDRWEDKTPREIQKLKNLQAIEFSDTDMDASIERIISDMKDVEYVEQRYHLGGEEFLKDILANGGWKEARFMFHSGTLWLSEASRKQKLIEMLDNGIHLKILLNTEESVLSLARHMHDPEMIYTSFEDVIAYWVKFRNMHPGQVEVRLSEIPILHRVYLFSDDDRKNGIMRVCYYTYMGTDVKKNCCQILSSEQDQEYFEQFQTEYEYLWNRAKEPE